MKKEEVFHASQYVIIKCFKNLCKIQEDLEELDINSSMGDLSILFDNLDVLENLIHAMETTADEDEDEGDGDEDEEDYKFEVDMASDQLSSSL